MLGAVSPSRYLTPYTRATWCLPYLCLGLSILGLLFYGVTGRRPAPGPGIQPRVH